MHLDYPRRVFGLAGHLLNHQHEARRLLRCCLHLCPRPASGVRRGGGGGRSPQDQRRMYVFVNTR